MAADSQVIVLGISDSNGDRARQIAQESAVVLTQLVKARFRTPQLTAAVLDPAHVVSTSGRPFARDAVLGAAAGIAAALAVLFGFRRTSMRVPTDEALAAREHELEDRIELVGKREREVARRAGELSRREWELANPAGDIARREGALENERREILPAAAVESEPETVGPEAPSEPPPPLRPHTLIRPRAGWNVNELERAIAARTDVTPGTIDEWRIYLFLLRGHANTEGTLPTTFDALVDDVFAELTGLHRGN
jgi:hypothetical protein